MANEAQETDGGAEARLTKPGGVTYMQIPATDVKASAAFYSAVFGWTASDRGSDAHLSFDDGATHMAGAFVTDRAIARDPGILPYIYVDGVDATLEKAVAHGGEVVTPA